MELTDVLDNISTGVLGLDRALRVRYLNPAAEAQLAISTARVCGLHARHIDSLPPVWLTTLEQALQEKHPIVRRGVDLTLANGGGGQVDLVITPLHEEGPVALVVEVQAVDRLQRISREESLLNAQEATHSLVRGLAHEIKNPLGGVRGAAQLLARALPEGELGEYTEIIIREADRLRDLVDRLLGPNVQPQLETLNVHEVLEHVCRLVRAEAGPSLDLSRDYDPSLPDILGDRTQLVQAVLNIARNALQATSGQQERKLSVGSRSQRQFTIGNRRHRLVCRVDIVDNGPGIPEELRHSLFVPMISGRAEGSGLGLAISQSIVNRHGGLLTCDSRPGRTRFSLYLPLEESHA
jgi:two-component system, NtrC family, nitrogen regulation sensor histidine kinase GlnL